MFHRNRHLNIFEHYLSAGTLPIENNVSRGFAIILESYPLVLDRFIDYINIKCAVAKSGVVVSKPERTEDFDVGFQQTISQIASSYSEISTVVGITLTTAITDEDSSSGADINSDLITDIVVVSNDTAIIIEVKRTSENAKAQLGQQVDSLIKELTRDSESTAIQKTLLSGAWDEIIDILQKSAGLMLEGERGVLSQYLQHLELRYQNWFPIKKLSEIDLVEENAAIINKRLLTLTQNCCETPDGAEKRWGSYIISLETAHIGAALVSVNYETKALEARIWVADTKHQGFKYFNNLKYDLAWLYETQLGVEDQTLRIIVHPYFRFAHFQSTVFVENLFPDYCKKNFKADKTKWYALWESVSREWKLPEWSKLASVLTERYDGVIDNDGFTQRFIANFENSNRGYVHVSLGFEVTVPIPFNIVLQKENISRFDSKEDDVLAALVKGVINKMVHRVE